MIIKCPECGHQISDKAPTCPSCGVEIAGHITRCPQCGDVFLTDQPVCPNCHHANISAPPVYVNDNDNEGRDVKAMTNQLVNTSHTTPPKTPKKNNWIALVLSVLIALIAFGVFYYYYSDAKAQREAEAYDYASTSNDPLVLQGFLDTYTDADPQHRIDIERRLQHFRQMELDWNNAVESRSKTAIAQFIDNYPESEHKQEAYRKIDSIDWVAVTLSNQLADYEKYVAEHQNGKYIEEAQDSIKSIASRKVFPEELQMLAGIFRHFFQSINSKDENGLVANVSTLLTNFLGKDDASPSDVVSYMRKIYRENVSNMNWRLPGDYQIKKQEVGDDEYEYDVTFTANQEIDYTDKNKTNSQYKIKAHINGEHKISELNMTRIKE